MLGKSPERDREIENIQQIRDAALAAIGQAQTLAELEALRIKHLGRKGDIALLSKSIGQAQPQAELEVIEHVERAAAALHRALAPLGRILLDALQRQQRVDVR